MRAVLRRVALDLLGRIARPTQRNAVRFFYGHGFMTKTVSAAQVERFRSILAALRNWYEFVPLPAAVQLLSDGGVRGRYLCFSFDDGFRDNHDYIAPILDEWGTRGCFFVVPNLVGSDDAARRRILREKLYLREELPTLDWRQIRSLSRAGSTIGCHTTNHENLSAIPEEAAVHEVLESKRLIQKELNGPCEYFAWPYGTLRHFPSPLLARLQPSFRGIFSAVRGRRTVSHGGAVINRDHFEPGWPVAHVRYFAARRVGQEASTHVARPI